MRIRYLDESSGCEAPDQGLNATPVTVVVGMIINLAIVPAVTRDFLASKRRYFPGRFTNSHASTKYSSRSRSANCSGGGPDVFGVSKDVNERVDELLGVAGTGLDTARIFDTTAKFAHPPDHRHGLGPRHAQRTALAAAKLIACPPSATY